MKKLISFFSVLAALAAVHAGTVDFTSSPGPVKPVHSVGQPPLDGDTFGEWTMMPYLKEANIPYSRMHDVGGWLGGGGLYVDVPNLFPDFAADETDPANYRFVYTDGLLAAMMKNGVEPFFRLGVTIENWTEYSTYEHAGDYSAITVDPPADYAKWARICEHIIKHYNEGWANGFHYGITYWEIWNEPDCIQTGKRNMWTGTWAQYIEFYHVASTYLKGVFGDAIKVGGYAATNIANAKYRTAAEQFLAAVRDGGWPLDFFSYHTYDAVSTALSQVNTVDELLNNYGFTRDKTERILNEWLPQANVSKLGTTAQAADIAAEIIGFQNGPLDLACLYDARSRGGAYGPLFNADTLQPYPAYYSLKAFGELYALGTAATCADFPSGVYVAAATDGADGNRAIMVVNQSSGNFNTANLDWGEDAQFVKAINATANYAEQDTMPATLARGTVWLFRLYDENGQPPVEPVEVASSNGCVYVTIQPGVVAESTPLYLAWDTEDKGEARSAWAHSAKLGDVTAEEGGTFTGVGATLGIPAGAKVRIFYGETIATPVETYESIKSTRAQLIRTDYIPTTTTGIEADWSFSGDFRYTNTGGGGTCGVTFTAIDPANILQVNFGGNADQSNTLMTWLNHSLLQSTVRVNATDAIRTARNTFSMKPNAAPRWGSATGDGTMAGHNAKMAYPLCLFGRYNEAGNASYPTDPQPFDCYEMTLYSFRIYEGSALVANFIPAATNGIAGVYDKVSNKFYGNILDGDDFTLGASSGIYDGTTPVADAIDFVAGGDEPKPTVVTVTPNAGQAKTVGEADPTLTYTLSPNIAVTGALAREAGEDVGTYAIKLGTLVAANPTAYTLELAATPVYFSITNAVAPPDPSTVPAVTSANGTITVTVPAGIVEDETDVYLVWDTEDKGNDFAAWTNKEKIGDVDAVGVAFDVEGADYKIPDGANIRVFVAKDGNIALYSAIAKTKSVSGFINLGYVPGKTKKTSGFDIDAKFANMALDSTTGAGMIFGICDYSTAAATASGQTCDNASVNFGSGDADYWKYNVWPHTYNHNSYKGAKYKVDPPNEASLATRTVLKARTGETPQLLVNGASIGTGSGVWPAQLTYDYNSTFAVFGRNNVPATQKDPMYFKYGDMTLYGLKIYEKPSTAHVCVADYIPAEKDGEKGLYDTISTEFYPASCEGFTFEGSATNTLGGVSIPSAAATYSEGGEEPPTVPQWMALYTEQASSDTSTKGGEIGNYTAYYCTVEAAELMFGSSSVDAVTQSLKDDYETGLGLVAGAGILLNASDYGPGQYGFIKYVLAVPFSQYLGFVFYDNGETNEFRVFGADNLEADENWLVFDDSEPGTVGGWTKPVGPGIPVGDNLTATFKDGVCTISGTGAMWEKAELGDLRALAITDLVIGEGVTSIGDKVFEKMRSIRSVTIGSTVTSIGQQAFDMCYNLTNVAIRTGASATTVGGYAFYRCNSLERIAVEGGSSVDWGENAFTLQAGIRMNGDTGLPEIYPIPAIVDANGYISVLYGTNDLNGNWTKITSDADRKNYHFFKIVIE